MEYLVALGYEKESTNKLIKFSDELILIDLSIKEFHSLAPKRKQNAPNPRTPNR